MLRSILNILPFLRGSGNPWKQAPFQRARSGHAGSKRRGGPNRNVNRMQRRSRQINYAKARA